MRDDSKLVEASLELRLEGVEQVTQQTCMVAGGFPWVDHSLNTFLFFCMDKVWSTAKQLCKLQFCFPCVDFELRN